MPAAVKLIIVAFIFYSTAIWSDKLQKQLKPWMLVVFIIGFLFDLVGTTIMSLQNHGVATSTHGRCGHLALLIITLHLIWAVLAIKKKGKYKKLFSKFSIYAWLMWTIALITGIPK